NLRCGLEARDQFELGAEQLVHDVRHLVLAVAGTSRANISTLDDAKRNVAVFGATGTGNGQYQVPNIMNKLFGTKIKLLPGFKTTAEIYLAIHREVNLRCGLEARDLFGTKFKLIPGFKTTAEIYLAMDRGEVDGIYGAVEVIAEVRPQWIAEHRFNWLA